MLESCADRIAAAFLTREIKSSSACERMQPVKLGPQKRLRSHNSLRVTFLPMIVRTTLVEMKFLLALLAFENREIPSGTIFFIVENLLSSSDVFVLYLIFVIQHRSDSSTSRCFCFVNLRNNIYPNVSSRIRKKI